MTFINYGLYMITMSFTDEDRALLVRQSYDLARIERLLIRTRWAVLKGFKAMSAATKQIITDMRTELTSNTNATAAVQSAIDTLIAKLEEAADDPVELQALLDGFKANSAVLAAAALKGTPHDENPAQPVPPVVG